MPYGARGAPSGAVRSVLRPPMSALRGRGLLGGPHRPAATAPAEGDLPLVIVEVGFGSMVGTEDGGVAWTNVTEFAKSIGWSRGRKREADRYDPGSMAVRFDNRDGRFRPEFGPRQHLLLPGDDGDYAQTPASSAFASRDTLEVRWEGIVDDWLSAVGSDQQYLISNYAHNVSGFKLYLNTTNVRFQVSSAGVNDSMGGVHSFVNGTRVRLRVFSSRVSGSSQMYGGLATTEWGALPLLFTDTLMAGVTIPAGSVTLKVGSGEDGVGLAGQVYVAEVSTDGTLVANPDFSNAPWRNREDAGDAHVDGAGRTWTLAQNAAIAGNPYYPNVRPLKRARVRTHRAGLDHNHVSAYVDSWDQLYAMTDQAECVMSATDGFKILAQRLLRSAWESAVGELGPTHWWRLGEVNPDTGARDSVGTVHGTYAGVVANIPKAVAQEAVVVNEQDLSMDTVDGTVYVDFAAPVEPIPTAPFTVVAWVTLDSLDGTDQRVVWEVNTDGDTQSFHVRYDGTFAFFFSNDAPTVSVTVVGPAAAALAVDTAYFLAASWTGTTGTQAFRFQVDGSRFYGALTASVSATLLGDLFRFGADAFGMATSNFEGRIDDVLTFDRVLTDDEVDQLFAAGSSAGFNTMPVTEGVEDLLNWADWPVSLRNYLASAGTTVAHGKYLALAGQATLDMVNSLAESDRAAAFMDRNGKLAFVTHGELLSGGYVTPQVTFGEGAGQIRYSDIEFDYSDQPIYNEAAVNNGAYLAGTDHLTDFTVVVQDDPSDAEFLPRTLGIDAVISTGEDEVLIKEAMADRAAYELAQFAQPHLRISSITLEPLRNGGADWPTILALELLTRCRVIHVPPDGATIDQELTIEGITHEYNVEASTWQVTLDMSGGGLAGGVYWLLGVPGFSELGVTTTLGF